MVEICGNYSLYPESDFMSYTINNPDEYMNIFNFMDQIQVTELKPPKVSSVYSTSASRWMAVTKRDSSAVGLFVYAVRTTRIYCRPNCSARLARRANVAFYDNAMQAEAEGFRACKRCKPNLLPEQNEDSVKQKIRQAVEIVQTAARRGEKVSLSELSQEVGLSKWHLQRVFKRHEGVSPREMSNTTMEAECARQNLNIMYQTVECSSTASSEPPTSVGSPLQDGSSVTSSTGFERFGDSSLFSDSSVEDILRDLFPDIYDSEQKWD